MMLITKVIMIPSTSSSPRIDCSMIALCVSARVQSLPCPASNTKNIVNEHIMLPEPSPEPSPEQQAKRHASTIIVGSWHHNSKPEPYWWIIKCISCGNYQMHWASNMFRCVSVSVGARMQHSFCSTWQWPKPEHCSRLSLGLKFEQDVRQNDVRARCSR